MTITTGRVDLLARMMDAAALRQNVIAQNVANVNTPGYQTLDVAFEDALHSALAADPSKQGADTQQKIVAGAGGTQRADGNNVDIDIEMARLQKNAILFKVYAQLIANQLAQQHSAISGR